MAYKGSDLSPEFKGWFKKEKARITHKLKSLGCTNIKLDYGFYYFSGFFAAPSGQVFYLCSYDVRFNPYVIYYRTAKDYKDYTGGDNRKLSTRKLDFWLS